MHMQYYIHVQSECINVELYKDLGDVLCNNGLRTIPKNVNYLWFTLVPFSQLGKLRSILV